MPTRILNYTKANLSEIAVEILALAKKKGASDADLDISVGTGTSVSVRMGALETIELNKDKSISITVYFNKLRGSSSTSDFSMDSINSCVEAACDIARYTSEDNAFGLAKPELHAKKFKDLGLHSPWEADQKEMIRLATDCENSALSYSDKIKNSEGSSFNTSESLFVYANSNGFLGGFPSSRHSLSCSVISSDKSGMQRDYSYSSARKFEKLKSTKDVGEDSASRALRRLSPAKIKTGRYPVIFEAPVAPSIISALVSAVSGGNLFRETSFLLNSLGSKVASSILTIKEDPFQLSGNASTSFDDDGVMVQPRVVVDKGCLSGYFLSTYSGKRLGMETTGNAGGAHNLIINSTVENLNKLIAQMDTGLIVTELMGQGLNMVTGDYSRGVAGLWVEKGVIKHAVEEITIAGNMNDMLMGIVGIGGDLYLNGSKYTGSILIESMTVASN